MKKKRNRIAMKKRKRITKNQKKIIKLIIVIIILAGCSPVILEHLVFRNDFYSVLDNKDWAGFLGSILSGVIGGIGTLYAIYISIADTQNKDKKEKKEKKVKDIYELLTSYISEIEKFYYDRKIWTDMRKKCQSISKDLDDITTKKLKKLDMLIQLSENYDSNINAIYVINAELEKLNCEIKIQSDKLHNMETALKNIDFSDKILIQLSYKIQFLLDEIGNSGQEVYNKIISINKFRNEIEKEKDIEEKYYINQEDINRLEIQTSELVRMANSLFENYCQEE